MQQPAEKPPLWYNFLLLALASTLPPQIHPEVFLLWDGLRQLSAILTLDVRGTAHSRSDWSLLNTPSMMASYARLTADLRAEGQRNNHEVSLLESEQELQRRITRCGRGEEGGREESGRRKGRKGEEGGREGGRGGGGGGEREGRRGTCHMPTVSGEPP